MSDSQCMWSYPHMMMAWWDVRVRDFLHNNIHLFHTHFYISIFYCLSSCCLSILFSWCSSWSWWVGYTRPKSQLLLEGGEIGHLNHALLFGSVSHIKTNTWEHELQNSWNSLRKAGFLICPDSILGRTHYYRALIAIKYIVKNHGSILLAKRGSGFLWWQA